MTVKYFEELEILEGSPADRWRNLSSHQELEIYERFRS
jgi:hypothetical protein